MRNYQNTTNEEYFQRNLMLSSLVMNPPYKIDGFNSSPKISKLLSLPLGVRINSSLLTKYAFSFLLSMSIFMLITSICIIFVYLPLQNKNTQLFNNIKKSTNNKLNLLTRLQETTSYNKLYFNASKYSFEEAEEIIHLNPLISTESNKKIISINKYPTIQFAGF